MIEVIIASRGRVFVGTYYSTFSGYITRLRGYYGMSKYTSYYGWNPVKLEMQGSKFFTPSNDFSREYPIGWVGIDGDERVVETNEDVRKSGSENVPTNGDGKASTANHSSGLKPFQVGLDAVQEANVSVTTKVELSETQNKNGVQVARSIQSSVDNTDTSGSVASLDTPAHGIRSLDESMIKSLGFLPNEDDEMEVSGNTTLYLVFSTDCSPSQHWESYLLFFSAMRTKQMGVITRIASGCTEEEIQETKEWHELVSSGLNMLTVDTPFIFADFFRIAAYHSDVSQVSYILHPQVF